MGPVKTPVAAKLAPETGFHLLSALVLLEQTIQTKVFADANINVSAVAGQIFSTACNVEGTEG